MFTTAAIAAFLLRFVPRSVADFLAPTLAFSSFVVDNFCATDPPATPNLVLTDFVNLLPVANIIDQQNARAKLSQWFASLYWCEVCVCDSGAVPSCAVGTVPPAPVGNDTGIPTGTTGVGCFTNSTGDQYTSATGHYQDFSSTILPSGLTHSVVSIGTGAPTVGFAIPDGTTSVQIRCVTSPYVSSSFDFSGFLTTFSSTGTSVAQTGDLGGPQAGRDFTATLAIGSTAKYWTVAFAGPTDATVSFYMEITTQCTGGGSSTLVQPCCPPDPALQSQLNLIMSFLQSIYASLPVAVTSYAESTAHTGLSGAGNISISGSTIAVRVVLTTIPNYLGREGTSPTFYFDAGFIAFVSAEGPYHQVRISLGVEVVPVPVAVNQIDYQFSGGVVATITELTRGA